MPASIFFSLILAHAIREICVVCNTVGGVRRVQTAAYREKRSCLSFEHKINRLNDQAVPFGRYELEVMAAVKGRSDKINESGGKLMTKRSYAYTWGFEGSLFFLSGVLGARR
jgi:hypothetical protein